MHYFRRTARHLSLPFLAATLALSATAGLAQTTAAPTKVSIGWGAFPDVPQFAVAAEQKLWAQHGLEAQIVPFASGRQGFEALIGGQLDYVVMTEFPATAGVLRKLDFAILAVLAQYQEFRVVSKATEPISGLAELAGKKIGVPIGTNVHHVLADALKKVGVEAKLLNVPPTELIPALARGDVDAIMSFPSAYANAKRILGAQYQEVLLPGYTSNYVLAASRAAKDKPEVSQRVLATLLQAENIVQQDPAAAQQDTAKFVGGVLTLEAIRAAWPEYTFRIELTDSLKDQMAEQGQWLVQSGYAKGYADNTGQYQQWLDSAPLQAVRADRLRLQNR